MGLPTARNHATITRARRTSLFKIVLLLLLFSFLSLLLFMVDVLVVKFARETKTVAGHNLAQTPWHRFPPTFLNESDATYAKALKFLKCTNLACLRCDFNSNAPKQLKTPGNTTATCPSFFRWIHHDLGPWAQSWISPSNLMEAQKMAAFRVVIVQGRLYVDFYYSCTQTRAMFTIWGLLQLLKRYPGMIPDVDMMFDCMDRPVFHRNKYRPRKRWPPPPLFRYCTTDSHFDIPFPDWSFWGWPETNIQPWDEEFRRIKQGSEAVNWTKKWAHAYWRGNPFVASPARMNLLRCNDTNKWGAEIYIQNWKEEAQVGYNRSSLADQCKHRYKIYAEGFAWSVSLKYILSCGSLSFLISPQFQDFFTRGLVPTQNYWPVSYSDLCPSIKFSVDWGNSNRIQAERIGKEGQNLMEKLSMERVYDYMYHLITEYSKLQNFKPIPPSTAHEVCAASVLCYADQRSKQFLQSSVASASSSPPCTLQPADNGLIESWVQKKRDIINNVERMEKARANGAFFFNASSATLINGTRFFKDF